MGRSWIFDSRTIARKVRNISQCSSQVIKDCDAKRECPNCHFIIDNTDVSPEWPGLPAGVKFDPTDEEIMDHLAAKCADGNLKPHALIDEFIPTLETDQGICYTHPENLPGVRKDGNDAHFFHKTSNAYASGQRKRRKIETEHSSSIEHFRWHKTGKNKAVIENGVHKGWKKIFSLYRSSKKGSKPEKSNWVIHQYHLGTEEDEKEGEYVVSKISYQQPKQSSKSSDNVLIEDFDATPHRTSPRTPMSNPPVPPRPGKSYSFNAVAANALPQSFAKEEESTPEASHASCPNISSENDMGYLAWLAGESQDIDDAELHFLEDNLLCNEVMDSGAFLSSSQLNQISFPLSNSSTCHEIVNGNVPCGIADLENLELDTPPDFHLAFGSQESIFDWIDRI
ncbi:SUPPRESSOR OF GAMMA RESPONSE 1 isoform X2 [Momordica charantia]|uniref:SUPPRESSOR OF GAMMA RESPONSE 1 isoform X2 n=1 Tax=Momordica charantia TaxID=3673 RepID=A0A6J1BWE7_MOMCH|nr:SUPPRESSOR OF GAMMA RESPONSE 1 isoform X2 [Momordica charantia]